jgi:hypothetical protein
MGGSLWCPERLWTYVFVTNPSYCLSNITDDAGHARAFSGPVHRQNPRATLSSSSSAWTVSHDYEPYSEAVGNYFEKSMCPAPNWTVSKQICCIAGNNRGRQPWEKQFHWSGRSGGSWVSCSMREGLLIAELHGLGLQWSWWWMGMKHPPQVGHSTGVGSQ